MAHTRWSVSLFVAAFWLPVAAFGQSPEFVTAMDRMAELYEKGQYQEAISYAAEALKLSEQELGPNHPITASPLAYLGLIHQAEGRYSEAAPFLERALEILEMALGPEHPDVAISLNNLSALFIEQGRYAEAEPLLDRALAILEKAFGPRHLARIIHAWRFDLSKAAVSAGLIFGAGFRSWRLTLEDFIRRHAPGSGALGGGVPSRQGRIGGRGQGDRCMSWSARKLEECW